MFALLVWAWLGTRLPELNCFMIKSHLQDVLMEAGENEQSQLWDKENSDL